MVLPEEPATHDGTYERDRTPPIPLARVGGGAGEEEADTPWAANTVADQAVR